MSESRDSIVSNLGKVTSYKFAKLGGFEGTEEEYGEYLANLPSYATRAEAGAAAAEEAQTSVEGSVAAVISAKDLAQAAATSAGASATSATASAATATSAKEDAVDAKEAAETAAETAIQTVSDVTEELQDIRVKADGTTAGSAGDAVRDQVEDLNSDLGNLILIQDTEPTGDARAANKVWIKKTASRVQVPDWDDFTELKNDLDKVVKITGARRYGVSGIGQAPHNLTRIYDAVGMTAQVGTDGDNSNVVNDFDNAAPFMRRKCVGDWYLVNGKAQFHVNAYKGDPDYAEDGSMGDYVAVECPRCYYYFDEGTLVISAHQYSGFRPFDIFCHNHDVNDTIPYYYLPAYSLVLKDGKAVSLPGYDNAQGNYKELLDAARTYKDGALGNQAILQPMAVNFYEWALYTVEFATTHCQSIMQGCAGLRHNNDDKVTFVDATHILTNNYFVSRVTGQRIAIIDTTVDINNKNYSATHEVVAVTRCDENGVANNSGTHQLLEVTDLGRDYYEYDTSGATEYRIAARPYPTGACRNVSTPSGSPVSNTDSFHPMQYRWRENVFSNQYKTVVDLFNKRVGAGDSDYYLEHYLLEDPTQYEPSSDSKPDAADLDTDKFVLLDVQTEHENYVNGYIKSKKYSDRYPDIWIPGEATGGSATTYFADYASLVSSAVVRSTRLGGHWYAGASDGFSFFNGIYAPSHAYATFGGDLCFAQ